MKQILVLNIRQARQNQTVYMCTLNVPQPTISSDARSAGPRKCAMNGSYRLNECVTNLSTNTNEMFPTTFTHGSI